MSEQHKTVFISYRRAVSWGVSRLIFDYLRAHDFDVFMDVETLPSGKWEQFIYNQIAARAHFIIVLANGTLERCLNPDDMLRKEIEHALRLDRNIIPVMIEGFKWEDNMAYLEGDLRNIADYNGTPAMHVLWDASMDRLRTLFLNQPLKGIITAAPAQEQQQAEAQADKVPEAPEPDDTDQQAAVLFAEAMAHHQRGDGKWAIEAFERAIALKSDDPTLYFFMGNTFQYILDDRENAEKVWEEVIRLEPSSALGDVARGRISSLHGDFDFAHTRFRKALNLSPQFADAHLGMAYAYHEENKHAEAVLASTHAIELNPTLVAAYNVRGLNRHAQKDYTGALEDYEHALNLNESIPMVYNNIGKTYHAQGKYDEALAYYKRALILNPNYDKAYKNRGLLHKEHANYKLAIRDFETYLELAGNKQHDTRGEIEYQITECKQLIGIE